MATTKRKKWRRRSRESSMYGSPTARNPFPISRSRLEKYHSCPRCFWIDRVQGYDRPGMPGFLLNTLVDTLLKREFDIHRENGTPHPYMSNEEILEEAEDVVEGDYANDDLDEFVDWADSIA